MLVLAFTLITHLPKYVGTSEARNTSTLLKNFTIFTLFTHGLVLSLPPIIDTTNQKSGLLHLICIPKKIILNSQKNGVNSKKRGVNSKSIARDFQK